MTMILQPQNSPKTIKEVRRRLVLSQERCSNQQLAPIG